jgi:hypothetical protein
VHIHLRAKKLPGEAESGWFEIAQGAAKSARDVWPPPQTIYGPVHEKGRLHEELDQSDQPLLGAEHVSPFARIRCRATRKELGAAQRTVDAFASEGVEEAGGVANQREAGASAGSHP